MTDRDFEVILVKGLEHTPGTRADFYRNVSKRHNVRPGAFAEGLLKAYNRLNSMVNTKIRGVWFEDEQGKRTDLYQTLNLITYCSLSGSLDRNNVSDLLPGIEAFCSLYTVQDSVHKEIELIWWKMPDNMLKKLLDDLKEKDYIDQNNMAHFKNSELVQLEGNGNQPIWWKKSARLLKYLMDQLARQDYIDRESPVNKHIKEHFIDKSQKPFTNSIKQNSSGAGLNISGKPKGHEAVDELINSIKYQPDQS